MQTATAMIEVHTETTSLFLEREASHPALKRHLLQLSDDLLDRRAVTEFARRLAMGTATGAMDGDDLAFASLIESARAADPVGMECLKLATLSGLYGAILRWPESAVFFEEISARLAVDPKRDLDVLTTASRVRASRSFGVRGNTAAMA